MFRSLSITVFLMAGTIAWAADWPQWLGPNRDNSTAEIVRPWAGTPPRIVWRVPVGEGNSAPVIAGGVVYLHTKIQNENKEQVEAHDAKTGELIWKKSYDRPEFKSLYGNGPRSTPCIRDKKIYCLGITGLLTCLDTTDGKILWQVDTLKQFVAKNLVFGVAGSPLIDNDSLFVNVGGKDASVVAFNRNDGNVLWKSLSDPASYSSPIFLGNDREKQLIFLTASGLTSLAPESGKLHWQYPLKDLLLESSTTPVKVGNRLVASSITFGTVCVKVEQDANKITYKEEWKNLSLTSYFSTPVAVGTDHLYMVTGANPLTFKQKAEATLHCVDLKSGKILWSQPRVGTYHAALLRTGDNQLLMLQDSGHLVLLNPDPAKYQELSRSKICGPTWAHPMLVDGKLYLRDDRELICIDCSK